MNEQTRDHSQPHLLREDAAVATRVLEGVNFAGPAADRHGRVNGALKPGSSADCIRLGLQDLFAYIATLQAHEPRVAKKK